jgi:methionine biosynthesis protein MetW
MNPLKRLIRYLFSDRPFKDETFDYTKYWDEYLMDGGYFISLLKLKIIEGHIAEGSSVLDIGCGDGLLLNHLKETRNIKGEGIDISKPALELARLKGLDVVQTDVTSPDFKLDKTYDYIIISEVLEHLPKPEDMIQKLKGKFTKYLIISIPNSGFFAGRFRLLAGKFPVQWRYHPSEHLRFWTVPDFCFWLKQLGFTVKDFYGLPFGSFDDKLMLWKYLPRLFCRECLFLVN